MTVPTIDKNTSSRERRNDNGVVVVASDDDDDDTSGSSRAIVPFNSSSMTSCSEDEDIHSFTDSMQLVAFENDKKQEAVDNEAMLHRLANHLGGLYGERPVVPDWARAATTCPSYYM